MGAPSVTIRLDIEPCYAAGHLFSWTLDPAFALPAAHSFRIERAETEAGLWSPVSPEMTGVYAWRSGRLLGPKDPALFFRVRMTAGGKQYYSPVRAPYGDLTRREFLIVAELMRKELLSMRQMSGVPALIWIKAAFGPACTACRDPVTGDVLKQNCKACYGTGRVPAYHGPYETWMVISQTQSKKGMENDQTSTRDPHAHTVRLLGVPRVKKEDILVDVRSDKRYYVDVVENVGEIRRVPAVQQVTANELASSSPVYRLGTQV